MDPQTYNSMSRFLSRQIELAKKREQQNSPCPRFLLSKSGSLIRRGKAVCAKRPRFASPKGKARTLRLRPAAADPQTIQASPVEL